MWWFGYQRRVKVWGCQCKSGRKPTASIEDEETKMDIDGDDSKLSRRIQTSPVTSEANEGAGSYNYPASFKLVSQILHRMMTLRGALG